MTLHVCVVGMALALAGCSAPRKPVAVLRAAAPVARAEVIASRSRGRVEAVQTRIATAQEAVEVLRKTATPRQKPAVEKVALALAEGQRLLRVELDENIVLTASLGQAQDGLTQVLLEQERIARELDAEQAKARAYWRLKLWIAGLAALLAGWVAWSFVPVILGPYRLYAAGGAGAAVFTAVMLIL